MTQQQVRGHSTSSRAMILDELREMHTAIPCYVNSYDEDTGEAEVTIPFSEFTPTEDGDVQEEGWPPVSGIPVWFPGGKKTLIDWEIPKGTKGFLIFMERNIARWYLSDGIEPTTPDSREMFGKSSPFLMTRIRTKRGEVDPATHIHLTESGEVQVKASAVRLGSFEADKALALAEKVMTGLNDIKNAFNNHTHICISPGAPCDPPIPDIGSIQEVASAMVFTNE